MHTTHHHVTAVGVCSGQRLVAGLHNHFFGQGAPVRILRFLGHAGLLSIVCTLLFFSLIIGAGMAGLSAALGFGDSGDSVRTALTTGSFAAGVRLDAITAGILGVVSGILWALESIVRCLVAEETNQTQSDQVEND